MRKTIYILLTLLGLCSFAGCSSSDDTVPALYGQLTGEWHLTTWNGTTPASFDAYMALNADGTFTIYQKIEQANYQKFVGSYRLSGTLLSGIYSDNTPWGSTYSVVIDDANKLTLTSNSPVVEVSVYIKAAIPDDVKNGATTMSVRSVGRRLL